MSISKDEAEYMIHCIEDKVYNVIVPQLVKLGYNEFRDKTFVIALNEKRLKVLGRCKRISDNKWALTFNFKYIAQATEDEAMNVIAHEVCHAYNRAKKHDSEWKKITQRMNRTYGYNIVTKVGKEILGDYYNIIEKERVTYRVVCTTCGNESLYFRMCGAVKNAMNSGNEYICGICGGREFDILD